MVEVSKHPATALMTGRTILLPQLIPAVLIGGILFCAACSHTTGPKGLSDSTYIATRKAVDALERASQYRNSSAGIFDPKLQAAVKAADEVYDEMGNQTADGYAVSQIRGCLEELKVYRSTFDSRESASQPIEEQLKGLKGAKIGDANDVVARSSRDLDACIKEAKGFL